MAITTWRDHPTGPPEEPIYERKCVDCEGWDPCPCCKLVGKCPKTGKWVGIGEGCEE